MLISTKLWKGERGYIFYISVTAYILCFTTTESKNSKQKLNYAN